MKTIILNASPRVGANCDCMVDLAGQRLIGDYELFNLRDIEVAPCCACNACKASGECIHADDATRFIAALDDADALLVTTPVYYLHVPGTLKVLLDRLYVAFDPAKLGELPAAGKKLGVALSFGSAPAEAVAGTADFIAHCMQMMGFAEHRAVLCGDNNMPAAFASKTVQREDFIGLLAWLES